MAGSLGWYREHIWCKFVVQENEAARVVLIRDTDVDCVESLKMK